MEGKSKAKSLVSQLVLSANKSIIIFATYSHLIRS